MDSDVEPTITDPKLRIVSREEWGANEPTSKEPIKLPAHRLFHTMTNTKRCMTKAQCIQSAREIQQFYMDKKGWPDLPYSFLVGGDLRVYEGRGWGVKIREAAEPMEQPTWKTGRVVIGYITKANDNSKHMDKMLDKGYKLMELGIDNNYLVDFRKHFPFRKVDFDNELEVEKYEEVARKVGNQCYQGFVPENEIIFDPTDDEKGSSFELKSEDEKEPTGDLFEEIEREKKEELKEKAEKIKKKVEDVYGCSDEDIVDREKRARTYGEEEYIGDYSDDHFQEDTGSTSELGHTTDEGKTGEYFDYPEWVHAKEDFEDDGLKETPKKTNKYDETPNKGQKASTAEKPIEAPTVNDELERLVAELKRNKESKHNVEFNKNNGDSQSENNSEKVKHIKVSKTRMKEDSRPSTAKEELKDLVRELERHRDSKNSIEYSSDEEGDEQSNDFSGMYNDKTGQLNIPVASGREIARAIIGGRESTNLESKDNISTSENVDKKHKDNLNKQSSNSTDKKNRKKTMKKRRKAKDQNTSNKYNTKSFSGIHSSDEEEHTKKVKLVKEWTAKVHELDRKRNEIGDFSPNDSDDYANPGDENTFIKDYQEIIRNARMDSTVETENTKPTNLKDCNLVTSTGIDADSYTENTNKITDQHEMNVRTGSINDEQDTKLTTDRTNDDSFHKVNEIAKEEVNKNLIMDPKKYFTRVNIAVIKKYLSERNKFIGNFQSNKNLKFTGEKRETNHGPELSGVQEANTEQKIKNEGSIDNQSNDKIESHYLNIHFDSIADSKNFEMENEIEEINNRNKDEIHRNEDLNNDNNINIVKYEDDIEKTKETEGHPLDEKVSRHEMKKRGVQEKYRRGSPFDNEELEKFYKEKVKPYKSTKRDNRSDKEVNTQVNLLLEDIYGPNTEKYDVGTYYDKKLGLIESSPEESVTELESSDIDPMDFNK